ncbi:hypothetical protein PVAP13_7KG062700 [Panicum virgatum]|uniref:Uncharacterized protein n=1 Tax=Panicum virgatum TaxID=38727 RepID=A0A8T0QEU9_PANVG|nr:hypothetical protein PVAP13_7KG062700 [Panicum virgatum]KAG2571053.1 hypothetical protein PVAP13_7KG062700 [Panicum virgatum]
MTDEQRQEINRKQREYRQKKKAESSHTTPAVTGGSIQLSAGSPFLSAVSTVVQTEDKENLDPDDPIEWLHRNDNYVPVRVTSYSTTTNSGNSSFMNRPSSIATVPSQGGSSSRDKLLKNRERYINMSHQKKDELLQQNRE